MFNKFMCGACLAVAKDMLTINCATCIGLIVNILSLPIRAYVEMRKLAF